MKICGLITEYNPFHNGHTYHLQEAVRQSHCDYTIAVMSGDFVQRGEPAVFDKYLRAFTALKNGVDLVIELPSYISTASAEGFAGGSIRLLKKLHIVDDVCFGSENGDTEILSHIASILEEEPPEYQDALKTCLKQGMTFPKARRIALTGILGHNIPMGPNDTLGIEYLRAIGRYNCDIRPIAIKRISNDYHDHTLTGKISSATSIRELLATPNRNPELLRKVLPESAVELLRSPDCGTEPIFADDASDALLYALIRSKDTGYIDFLDVSRELSDRIQNTLWEYRSFSQYCELLKTKELTYSRISRALLHILLDMRKDNLARYMAYDMVPYIKVLGFRKDASKLLKELTTNAEVPVLTNLSSARDCLDDSEFALFSEELRISTLYQGIRCRKTGYPMQNEMTRKMLVCE